MRPFTTNNQFNIMIRNARILNPEHGMDQVADIQIENGKIVAIADKISQTANTEIDAQNAIVMPGWFDMHAHFREPGREDEETIQSGCSAAIAGGFTGVSQMPDTEPAIEVKSALEVIFTEAAKTMVDVYPIAALTKQRKGQELTEIAELAEAGAVAFSDADHTVASAQILRNALDYASMYNKLIIETCDVAELSKNGHMNEGAMSTRLGLPGIPAYAEEIIVSRDLHIAEYARTRIHLSKISTANSVALIRDAKQRGVQVTCDVTVHHCIFDDREMARYDTNFKVLPPLRAAKDVAALIDGLNDGTIDAIVTDHTPHSPEEKYAEMLVAPEGTTGLETALPALFTHLVKTGKVEWNTLIEKCAINPRKILGLALPAIKIGELANFVMFNPEKARAVQAADFYSRSRNCIFLGEKLDGQVEAVFNRGQVWRAMAL